MGEVIKPVQRMARNISYPNKIDGAKLTIGTTATQVITHEKAGWITLKADASNTDTIWIGDANVADEDGYALAAEEFITIEYYKLSEIYAIGGAASQVLWVFYGLKW